MGNGYHSRSPEELRKYLESLNLKPNKKPWMHYIIFANIIGVLFVIFVIIQDKSLGLGFSFKASNKIQVSELESYFVMTNESNVDSVTYFLFVQNQSHTESIFPKEDMKVLFTLTTDEKEECLQKLIDLQTKKIMAQKTEFFSFSIEESEIKKTNTCNTFFHRVKTRSLLNIFSKGNRKFTPELNLIYNNQIYMMSISN